MMPLVELHRTKCKVMFQNKNKFEDVKLLEH